MSIGTGSLHHMNNGSSDNVATRSKNKIAQAPSVDNCVIEHTVSENQQQLEESLESCHVNLPSQFIDVELSFPIPVFQLTSEFKADSCKDKINLSVGAFRTDEGKPWVLPVIKYVEAQIAIDPLLDHEYLPILGLTDFCDSAIELCLGKDSIALINNRATAVQSLSGTGALRLAAEFLYQFYNKRELSTAVYISDPTWGNHYGIFRSAGFGDIRHYRYWSDEGLCLDVAGLVMDLRDAPLYSIVVFHACAHNPTGIDPSHEVWELISKICFERKLFPVFDCAYQGFATGDPDLDAWSIRFFVKSGFELLVCMSFSKTFGLYNERIGALILVLRNSDVKTKCRSQLEHIIRTMYSNPPSHGARLVAAVLKNPALKAEWLENLKTIVDRIKAMRRLLHAKLRIMGTPGCWDHIIRQYGMFSYTGLSAQQVEFLTKRKHIYLMRSGRINMCGLNASNIDYFVQCVDEAVRFFETDKTRLTYK